jgi:hypothetical protein
MPMMSRDHEAKLIKHRSPYFLFLKGASPEATMNPGRQHEEKQSGKKVFQFAISLPMYIFQKVCQPTKCWRMLLELIEEINVTSPPAAEASGVCVVYASTYFGEPRAI